MYPHVFVHWQPTGTGGLAGPTDLAPHRPGPLGRSVRPRGTAHATNEGAVMRSRHTRGALGVAFVALLALVAAGCGSSSKSSSTGGGGGGGGGGPTIALLPPENQTARYETHDKPDFVAKVKTLCPSCNVLYSNATGDAT